MGKKYLYNRLTAGGLLVFDSIDFVDISLLSKDIQDNLGIEFYGYWGSVPPALESIIERSKYDPKISIRKDKRQENVSPEIWDCTVRSLEETAGKELVDYFRTLNIKDYFDRKAKREKIYRRALPQHARILLISESSEDYDDLVNQGFSQINWFRSYVLASKFFKENHQKLEDHNLIILGESGIERYPYEVEGDRVIFDLAREKNIAKIEINRYSDSTGFSMSFENPSIGIYKNIYAKSFNEVMNGIVECASGNFIIENDIEKNISFERIKINAETDKLPLPTKKGNVRILYLISCNNDYVEDIQKKIDERGLDVTLVPDNNFAMLRHVYQHLGEYDIIIASSSFSSRLLKLTVESVEQSNITGRQKVLLSTYCINGAESGLNPDGSKISLEYIHDTMPLHAMEFTVTHGKDCSKFDEVVDDTNAILDMSLKVYSDALEAINHKGIKNLHSRSIVSYNDEWKLYQKCKLMEKYFKRAEIKFGRHDNYVISLPNQLGFGMINGCIAIAGIYNGKLQQIYVPKNEKGIYSVSRDVDREMLYFLIDEIIKTIKLNDRKCASDDNSGNQKRKMVNKGN